MILFVLGIVILMTPVGTPVGASSGPGTFTPPYWSSGNSFGTTKGGTSSAFAFASANHVNGYLYIQASASAGMPYGNARADTTAAIAGPKDLVITLPSSRTYSFVFTLRLTGSASNSKTTCGWLGCMSSNNEIAFDAQMYAVGGGIASEKVCSIYTTHGTGWYQSWSNTLFTCSWSGYLYAGSYWFWGFLKGVMIVANTLVGLATAATTLTAYMASVGVY